jgi:hypothetical protein
VGKGARFGVFSSVKIQRCCILYKIGCGTNRSVWKEKDGKNHNELNGLTDV